jgi:hypothetical protein
VELEKKNYSIYNSSTKNPGHRGTGFYVDKTTRNSVLAFEPVNDRICYLRLKSKFQNISMVTCHAPSLSEEKDDTIKDEFYDRLTATCNKISKHDVFILLGDFNAKVGKEDFITDVAGKHSLHDILAIMAYVYVMILAIMAYVYSIWRLLRECGLVIHLFHIRTYIKKPGKFQDLTERTR